MQKGQTTQMNKRIGKQLRMVRHLRHMTIDDLADRMMAIGDDQVSGKTIGRWERGERVISSLHLLFLSKALECSPNVLVVDHGHTETTEELLIEQIKCLSEHEQKIMLWIATEWEGNKHPLIQLSMAYARMNNKDRQHAAAYTIAQYKKALTRHALQDVDVLPNLQLLERETNLL